MRDRGADRQIQTEVCVIVAARGVRVGSSLRTKCCIFVGEVERERERVQVDEKTHMSQTLMPPTRGGNIVFLRGGTTAAAAAADDDNDDDAGVADVTADALTTPPAEDNITPPPTVSVLAAEVLPPFCPSELTTGTGRGGGGVEHAISLSIFSSPLSFASHCLHGNENLSHCRGQS